MAPLKIKRSTGILVLIMLGIFLSGIWYADHYYKGLNTSEDPRVKRAKQLYNQYNQLAEEKKYQEIFELLDSMEFIYDQFDDYKESYEVGVLYNNRAAIFLNMALFDDYSEQESDSLILLAQLNLHQGILIYENWMQVFSSLTEKELLDLQHPIYDHAFPQIESSQIEKYVWKRTYELMEAQKENDRRLSVAYTNLGIVYRYQNQIEEAVHSYQKALELWEENLTAENNINILLGRPLKQRSLLDRLFPPEK